MYKKNNEKQRNYMKIYEIVWKLYEKNLKRDAQFVT